MATWKALIEKHTDTIDTTTGNTGALLILNEIIAESMNDCMDACVFDLLYKYAAEPLAVDSSGLDVSNRKLIAVELNGKVCQERSFWEKDKFSDPASIQYATKESPIYYVKNLRDPNIGGTEASSTLFIFPDTDIDIYNGLCWNYQYQTSVSNTSETSTSLSLGVPPQLVDWIVIKSAEKVVEWRLGQMIYSEEDAELTSMVQGQMSVLAKLSQDARAQFGIHDKIARRIQGGSD